MRPLSIGNDALAILMRYGWPGNVRQLAGVLFRAALQADGNSLTANEFPHIAIQSRFCTEDPRRLNFPVKIMFVVDTSQSMLQTDPTGQRLIAVQEVVDAFIPDPGVEFAIIQFSGAAAVLTNDPDDGQPGFTRDYMDLTTAIVRLGLAEQPTDYEGALSATQLILARDMMKTTEEDLARSKYVVIFLSDGLPNPVVPPTNTRNSPDSAGFLFASASAFLVGSIVRWTRSFIICSSFARDSLICMCLGPLASAVRNGRFISVSITDDSSIFAFSAASRRRWITILSLETSMPWSFLNSATSPSITC